DMSRMVRKQIYIKPGQEETLKRRAKELGITEAELVRRAIDQISRSYASVPPNLQAWEEEKEFIRKHRSMDVPQTGRTWTRDELYEERLERYSR
ncbi:MAG: hypothetical protein Q8O86_10155, partial [Dehalococcoidia bacterium]|nr:hypothetical protein [Dehalococcoidia bacterium]